MVCHQQSCVVEEKCSTSPRWCFLSPPRSSRVSVTEVCPAASLHVRRILSLSINWSQPPTDTHTHTHTRLQTRLHNGTRISGLRELYSLSFTVTFFSRPSSHTHTHKTTHFLLTCHMLNTHPPSHTHTQHRLLCNSLGSWSLAYLRFFCHRILTKGNIRRCWQSWLGHNCPLLAQERNTLVWVTAEQLISHIQSSNSYFL